MTVAGCRSVRGMHPERIGTVDSLVRFSQDQALVHCNPN
ncbi:hypothetical protein [Polaromonas sp. CG9_12]|nr:hypothetical protein [Polaromonas sp. CG9_12]